MSKPPRKPWYLSADDWRELWKSHDGAPRCADCGTTDRLSLDHIRPRFYGGTHDLSNLTFRCIRHNSAKGVKGDPYWSRTFFWDQLPNFERLWTLHRRIWDALTLDEQVADYFSEPAGVIAGKLYLIAAVVGAGKTIAMPVIAMAYNLLQRRQWAATRRADCILILTKEQNVRDQIAVALKNDLTDLGILPSAPHVEVLERYDQLNDDTWLSQKDAVVACVQLFWEKEGGPPRDDVASRLRKFPLAFIDETHFGHRQVQELLKIAPQTVFFGTTGSPIRRDASLLGDYVLVTQYTYQDADEHDRSLKYLHDDEDLRPLFVTPVRMDSADLLVAGHQRTVSDVTDPDYDAGQLAAAGQVAMAVIRHMERCDAAMVGEPAAFRDPDRATADLLYPVHAIIRCPTIAFADMLHKQIQAFLNGTRFRYPLENGWNAAAIFMGDGDIPGEKLDPENHPWMRAWSKLKVDPDAMRFFCDRHCVRILLVVGMAREGVNNPLCCVTAQVDGKKSVVLGVQGLFGRGLRAVYFIDGNGERHIPPAPLDTVHVFYHEGHPGTGEELDSSIKFLMNMEEHFKQLPTVGQLISGHIADVEHDPKTADDPLTASDRVRIAVDALRQEGESWRDNEEAVERIIKREIEKRAPSNQAKAARVREWIRGPLRRDPDTTWRMTRHAVRLEDVPQVAVLLDERARHELSDEQLREFIRWNKPQYAPYADDADDKTLHSMRGIYEEWAAQRILPQPPADDTLEGIRASFTKEIKEFLKGYLEGPYGPFQSAAHKYIGRAVQRVLGAEGETVGKGTKWDCPQVHILLQRPDIKRAIQDYARSRLILDGYCPEVTRALGIDPNGQQE